jgi:regulatory protein YycI of two-component signal transduction system YycFG
MDWGRAKSVLIFAFLLLNVVLGYQLWSNIREGLSTNADTNDLPADTLALMQEKNITFASDMRIPSETPELRDLTFRVTTKLGKGVRHELKNPVESKVVFNESELVAALGSVIPDLDQYTFDYNRENVFVFDRMAQGRPMFDVKLELFYSNQKITAYRQDVIQLVPSDDSPLQTVLPAKTALASLIENHLHNGAVIREIKLGYHGQDFDSETQFTAPTWRVLLDDGSGYYFDAVSAEVETFPEE